ncbi:hypothetical protein [Stackebrandtia soli]|uniref:hypothetical protein n=1 Tax=Stackebrandtia soli TaxID=1892856 RepID=UPI0039E73DE9
MNNDVIVPLLGSAVITDWSRVLDGHADLLTDSYRGPLETARVLPISLIKAVLGGERPELLLDLLANQEIGKDPLIGDLLVDAALSNLDDKIIDRLLANGTLIARSDVRERLAASGRVAVLRSMFGGYTRLDLRLRRIAAAASEAEVTSHRQTSNALVYSPFPQQVSRILTHPSVKLTRAEQLRGLLSIHEHGDLTALDRSGLEPTVSEIAAQLITTDDDTDLRRALAEAEGTRGAIEELHEPILDDGWESGPVKRLRAHRDTLDVREDLDWELLREADRTRPFGELAAAALASMKDIPEDFRLALLGRHPEAVAKHGSPVDASLLTADWPSRSRAKITRALVKHGLGVGVSAEDVLHTAKPAIAALEITLSTRDSYGPSWQEFQTALADLVGRHLGDSPNAWLTVASRMARFGGTIGELLGEAADTRDGEGDATWPAVKGAPKISGTLSGRRAALICLLNAAPDSAHSRLIPLLDEQTLRDLFHRGHHRDTWRAHTDVPGRAQDAWIAVRESTGPAPGPVQRLAACETAEQHRKLMLTGDGYSYEIVVRGRVPQLRVFLDVWQRFGATAVRETTELKPVRAFYTQSRAQVLELLNREDLDAALEELRAEVEWETGPDGQTNAWRTRTDLAELSKETYDWDWAALEAAHRRTPFSPDAVWRLSRAQHCPASLVKEAETILPSRIHRAYTKLMAGVDVAKVLKDNPADSSDSKGRRWIRVALDAGRITWDDVFQHAHPVSAVLRMTPPERLAPLMAATIGDDPQAWILAARMVPDFPGSVAELLTTAAAAS